MVLKTEFLTRSEPGMGETWTARIAGQSRIARPLLVSLILYVYNEGAGEMAFVTSQRDSVEEIYGYTPDVSVCVYMCVHAYGCVLIYVNESAVLCTHLSRYAVQSVQSVLSKEVDLTRCCKFSAEGCLPR